MKFETLQKIAALIAADKIAELPALIDSILETETGAHWIRDLNKLKLTAIDNMPRFRVIAKGNGKLPFLAFSSLPGRGFCPGAGDCLKFCYSFRAWRYPAAFCRQAQNSILLQSEKGRASILSALDSESNKIKSPRVDFRLYVDGDFSNRAQIAYWFNAIAARPKLAVYGYSKSWAEIIEHAETGGTMPANYLLNLSSGSVHGNGTKARMQQLPITRGEFVAVNIGRKVKSTDHGTKEHNRELRAAYKTQTGRKGFTCPGACGDCTLSGHACGLDKFRNIDVIIAVH
jgi:hypothetical protein